MAHIIFTVALTAETLLALSVMILGLYLTFHYLSYYTNQPIAGRAVLITGCDVGFGNAIAKALDALGCIVLATCLKSETAKLLNEETSSRTMVHVMDVTNIRQIKQTVAKVNQYLSAHDTYLYGLVNNAGIIEVAPFECISTQKFNGVINVNLLGVCNVCRLFIPLMRLQTRNINYPPSKYGGVWNRGKRGRIVNIASMAGVVSAPFLSSYNASKHGVLGFTNSLRFEMQEYFSLFVSSVQPSFNQTALFEYGMNAVNQSRIDWRLLPDSKALMETYNLEQFIACIESKAKLVRLVTNRDLSKVVRVVVCALSSRMPLQHYYPTYAAAVVALVKHVLPAVIFDGIVEKLFFAH